MSEGKFTRKDVNVNLHPNTVTPWVTNSNENYFDFFGCVPPNLLTGLVIAGNGKCGFFNIKTVVKTVIPVPNVYKKFS